MLQFIFGWNLIFSLGMVEGSSVAVHIPNPNVRVNPSLGVQPLLKNMLGNRQSKKYWGRLTNVNQSTNYTTIGDCDIDASNPKKTIFHKP